MTFLNALKCICFNSGSFYEWIGFLVKKERYFRKYKPSSKTFSKKKKKKKITYKENSYGQETDNPQLQVLS